MDKRGTRILVIEDDHHLRELLEFVLDLEEDIDDVRTLGDGRRAAEVLRQYRPDVVVLDVQLPHVRGDKVAEEIRIEDPEVRIISMSGFDPGERPWADHQVVKTGTLLQDLRDVLVATDGEETLDVG